jgi:hypothetical protein
VPVSLRGGSRPAGHITPLSYGGGGPVNGRAVIQGRPRVYIVYWGSQRGTETTDSQGDYTFSKVITSPAGTNPGGGFPAVYCGRHSDTTQLPWSGDDVSYTNMPYVTDSVNAKYSCGQGSGS